MHLIVRCTQDYILPWLEIKQLANLVRRVIFTREVRCGAPEGKVPLVWRMKETWDNETSNYTDFISALNIYTCQIPF